MNGSVADRKPVVFIVEDEKDVAGFVKYFLDKEGYAVQHFLSGESFLEAVSKAYPDLVILDLMLPGVQGVDVCRYLKQDERLRTVPVIMLTAKDDPIDVVLGLEVGADDYVTKPFHPRELLARIKAVTRRAVLREYDRGSLLKAGIFLLNGDELSVTVEGEVFAFSWREFKIIELLARNKGKIISRETVLNRIWGNDEFITDRTVDVYIANIRKKLGVRSEHIVTVRGAGYRFEP
ncbi:MAG TPA: response regulator transcription factor [Atribacteraceae bacterium]|nr:response regulator transcription factor [Atribacteraceae bacterium]